MARELPEPNLTRRIEKQLATEIFAQRVKHITINEPHVHGQQFNRISVLEREPKDEIDCVGTKLVSVQGKEAATVKDLRKGSKREGRMVKKWRW